MEEGHLLLWDEDSFHENLSVIIYVPSTDLVMCCYETMDYHILLPTVSFLKKTLVINYFICFQKHK